ncbi:threonine aldolase family protein [Spirillospora sp. CA-128828]|uniref:threonine aldolase family protein n=1 Tax=Spirillospora sp. CA-128828 TaxID=3240033 RepID=UPI003D907D3C
MTDLRSDTLTRPTAAMRAAIAAAEVGDEQRGEDPTVNLLLERVRALLGKEAALFLPGGTMCNNIAIAAHTRPGDAILAHRSAHILRSESAGAARLAQVQTEALDGAHGRITARQVEDAVTAGSRYEPATRLLCVEQTHNFGGGAVWPLAELGEVCAAAHAHGLAVHMDGARLLNAAVATGVPAHDFAAHVDSVWICFTKGLGAPIGAVLAGTEEFIACAGRLKHAFGGALRQAGIAAAGCLYALDHHVQRLADDHALARRLADGLRPIEAVRLHTPRPDTNMVFFDVDGRNHAAFLDVLATYQVRLGAVGPHLRAVTHLDVTADDIDRALEAIEDALGVDCCSSSSGRP